MARLEDKILDKGFVYKEPYFYNFNLALRCELDTMDGEKYSEEGFQNAFEIYQIIFQEGVDALFYDNFINDYDFDNGDIFVKNVIKIEKKRHKFNLGMQSKYKHAVIRDIDIRNELEGNNEIVRINRIVCYPYRKHFPMRIMSEQLNYNKLAQVNFVSFKHQCILSIYDERGCDIVFFDKDKFKYFYPLLEPYFLQYDIELMKERLLTCE